jgi:WD40 repeat protein
MLAGVQLLPRWPGAPRHIRKGCCQDHLVWIVSARLHPLYSFVGGNWCILSVRTNTAQYPYQQPAYSLICTNSLLRLCTHVACSDGKIVLWDTATLEPQITLTGHVGNVLCCGINEEGSRIVSSGEDCTVRVGGCGQVLSVRSQVCCSARSHASWHGGKLLKPNM